MAQKNETLPLLLALIITGTVIGGGIWWFLNRSPKSPPVTQTPQAPVTETPVENPVPLNPAKSSEEFPLIAEVPLGTVIRIDGSTSMVQINERMKQGFAEQFPGSQVISKARGSQVGINDLINQNIDLAAVSRPLTPAEAQQGLVAVPVARDAIAVFVGTENPFKGGLTAAQVAAIFRGEITNWSEVGGNNIGIEVINRPAFSGTHQFFQEIALQGQPFGSGPNIITLERDATTPIINSVGTNGISYATYSQVINQSQARILPIDGLDPLASDYPYQRVLYYVYKEPASFNVKAFLGYLKSPQGQQNLQ